MQLGHNLIMFFAHIQIPLFRVLFVETMAEKLNLASLLVAVQLPILFLKIYHILGLCGALSFTVFVYLRICVFVFLSLCV